MPRNEARTYRHIEVVPASGSLGAEIRGVDVAAALAGSVIAEIRQALLDHLVIFFRDQKLAPREQLAFAGRFGEPMEYPQLRGLPECPLITPVLKLADEKVNFGGVWHTDTTYLAEPPMASMLYAVELPPYGGDTVFANQYQAYETLSEGLRRTLDGLVGVNTSTKADASKTREDRLRAAGRLESLRRGETQRGCHAGHEGRAEPGRGEVACPPWAAADRLTSTSRHGCGARERRSISTRAASPGSGSGSALTSRPRCGSGQSLPRQSRRLLRSRRSRPSRTVTVAKSYLPRPRRPGTNRTSN